MLKCPECGYTDTFIADCLCTCEIMQPSLNTTKDMDIIEPSELQLNREFGQVSCRRCKYCAPVDEFEVEDDD